MAEGSAGDQDGGGAQELSVASSPHKETQQLQLELRLLEALEVYSPSKLQGVHRHFILYGLITFLEKRLNRPVTADEILHTLNGFYNLDMLKPDDDEIHREDFSLPSYIREDLKDG